MATEKNAATSEAEVQTSVASLYANILAKRKAERSERQRIEDEEKAARKAEKEAAKAEGKKETLTKKEKRDQQFANWQSVIVGLTGDDLEYSSDRKKRKKKYKNWIGDEDSAPTAKKPKKVKKKNYNRIFAPELNMLRTLSANQNRLATEMQRRFQNAAGPATKDAMPLNKTLVDMAAVVNSSSSNALSYLNAIASVKKTIAELYIKQAKDEAGKAGSGETADLSLIGSAIGNSILGDGNNPFLAGVGATGGQILTQPGPSAVAGGYVPPEAPVSPIGGPTPGYPPEQPRAVATATPITAPVPSVPFDPQSWDGGGLSVTPEIMAENTPADFVMVWNKGAGTKEFKAFKPGTTEEIPGYPIPAGDPYTMQINEKDLTVRGEFDQTYKVIVI